jgi:hypothetical protein
MADFMGDDGIHLRGVENAQQGVGNQDIAEPAHQAHHPGGDHAAAENGPVKDIGVPDAGTPAKRIDALAEVAGFPGSGNARISG